MIQLQTVHDTIPIEAPYDIDVSMISSDPSVIGLDSDKVVMKQGESMIKVPIRTTLKAGVASITAQTEGVRSSTVTLNTIALDSLDPTSLAVYVSPSSLVPDSKFIGMLYIQLLNSQGLPATSKNSVPVTLSSSESTIGTVPTYVTIPAGQSGVFADFTPKFNTGQTIITASAAGLAPGKATAKVDGPVATKLVVEFGPDVMAAVNLYDTLMSVQLRDDDDVPVKAAQTVKVTLRSSDTSILEVPQTIDILAGHSFATAYVKTRSGSEGTATITASAFGYESGFGDITTKALSSAESSDTKSLQIFSIPSILPPDNSEHESIIVAFYDSEGKPYGQFNHVYQNMIISSSNREVGTIADGAFLTKSTYAVAKFDTRYINGETKLTASLQGYTPSQYILTVAGSAPTSIALTQIPGVIQATNSDSNSLVVSLLDTNGKPVAAQEDTQVFLTTSDPEIATTQASVTITAGTTYTIAGVHTTLKAGQTTITGAASGLDSGSIQFKSTGFSGSISEYSIGLYIVPTLPADQKSYESIVVQLQDQHGNPVKALSDIPISLSSGSFIAGTVQKNIVIPKGASYAIGTFTPSVKDDKDFKITASSPGYKSVDAVMSTEVQKMTIVKSTEFLKSASFEGTIPVSVDVFSAQDIPVRNAMVKISGVHADETTVMTDENGHAEGIYKPTLPGANSIIVTVSKPGYEDATVTSAIALSQTVNLSVNAETEKGKEIAATIKVKGPTNPKSDSARPGSPLKLTDAKWGVYTLTPQSEIKTDNARYKFVAWSDGVTDNPRVVTISSDAKLTAIYSAQYLLQIDNQYGSATGGGYYPEGAKTTISISPTSVGNILIDKSFGGWSGDINTDSATTDVTMNGPKTVKAVWNDNYLKVIIIAIAAGAGGFAYYYKVYRPKKENADKQKAPDLDWYKS